MNQTRKKRLPQQRLHWYRIEHVSCPVCWHEDTYRERVYGRKPKQGAVKWTEQWCGGCLL